MENFTLRKIGNEAVLVLRRLFVYHYERNVPIAEKSVILLVHISTLYSWLRIYKANKKALFVIQSPGPKPGHVGTNGRLLNSAQEREIKKIITACQPTDTGCGSINRIGHVGTERLSWH
jgi:hypothetical protein